MYTSRRRTQGQCRVEQKRLPSLDMVDASYKLTSSEARTTAVTGSLPFAMTSSRRSGTAQSFTCPATSASDLPESTCVSLAGIIGLTYGSITGDFQKPCLHVRSLCLFHRYLALVVPMMCLEAPFTSLDLVIRENLRSGHLYGSEPQAKTQYTINRFGNKT